jgi:hypothetical protein
MTAEYVYIIVQFGACAISMSTCSFTSEITSNSTPPTFLVVNSLTILLSNLNSALHTLSRHQYRNHESSPNWRHRELRQSPRCSSPFSQPQSSCIRPLIQETRIPCIHFRILPARSHRRLRRHTRHQGRNFRFQLRRRCQRCWTCISSTLGPWRLTSNIPRRSNRRTRSGSGKEAAAESVVCRWDGSPELSRHRNDAFKSVSLAPTLPYFEFQNTNDLTTVFRYTSNIDRTTNSSNLFHPMQSIGRSCVQT